MLQVKATLPIHLQRMDEISSRATSRSHVRVVEVARAVNILQDVDLDDQPMTWWIVGIITSIVIGSLWPIWFRLIKCGYNYIHKRTSNSARAHKPPTNKKTNTCGTELQQMRQQLETRPTEEVLETIISTYSVRTAWGGDSLWPARTKTQVLAWLHFW